MALGSFGLVSCSLTLYVCLCVYVTFCLVFFCIWIQFHAKFVSEKKRRKNEQVRFWSWKIPPKQVYALFSSELQKSLGARNKLLVSKQLKQRQLMVARRSKFARDFKEMSLIILVHTNKTQKIALLNKRRDEMKLLSHIFSFPLCGQWFNIFLTKLHSLHECR